MIEKKWQLLTLTFAAVVLTSLFMSAGARASTESDFLILLNQERATQGKAPLVLNAALTNAAQLHSQDMASNGYFSHTSLDGTTFTQRMAAAGYSGYSMAGENIAYSYGGPDAMTVFTMWKNSPGHYSNMMNSFNEAGLGVATVNGYTYYTLDLGKRNIQVPASTTTTITTTTRPTTTHPTTTTIHTTTTTIPTQTPPSGSASNGNGIDVRVVKYVLSGYTKYVIVGRTDAYYKVEYNLDGMTGLICSSCRSFSTYIRSYATPSYVLSFKDKLGNVFSRKVL